jgi:hypothetical protein
MLNLVLGAAIVIGLRPTFQLPPVFKAETYVVAHHLTMSKNGTPWVGLTAADLSITLEKKISVPLHVAENPDRPGDYELSFDPPEAVRDGKTHKIDVLIKYPNGKWKTLPLKWTATFTKPI